jgi:exonuclease SbcC
VRITRVELDNIKSYRHASISLREGTTAVRGQNAAGKSTLVEAIGFALFDAMSYNQAQFVREGERSGQVAVTFISALDDREYQVVRRCGSSPAWYVYDPELGSRVVEQRADVVAYLRQHLRIEGEVELSALFTDALGVTQGTFTADFLLTPAQRKKKFDTLLQVEDYRKAAEKLNETRAYLVDQCREQEGKIAELERETAQLPAWRAELADQHALARALAARLEAIQRESSEIEVQREGLRRAEAEVTRRASAVEVAATSMRAAQSAIEQAAGRHDEAHVAREICAATQADHQAYVAAETALAAAHGRDRERSDLRARRGEVARRLEGVQRDRVHALARLAEASAAAQRVVELQPAVERQRALEIQLHEARLRAEQYVESQQRLAQLQQEHERMEPEAVRMQRRIGALEALRPLAEQLPTARARLEALQAADAARAQREQRLRAIQGEREVASKTHARTAERVAKLAENVRKIRSQQAIADELPAREATYRTADEEVRRLEARQEHHRLSRQQAGQGHCPFLAEPCLNIQRRGENSLATYFDRLIAQDEAALAPARKGRDVAERALRQAQKVSEYVERLPDYEERYGADREQLEALDSTLARLAEEDAELSRMLADAPDAPALARAREEARQAEDADRQVATLPTLQQQHTAHADRLAQLVTERDSQRRRMTELASAKGALDRIDGELAALGDPRAESAAQTQIAAERPRLEAALAQASAQAERLESELRALDDALAPYVGLDDELRAGTAEVERTREGHLRFLRHEQIALRLPVLAAALAEARAEYERATAAFEAAQAAYDEARARFDPVRLAALGQRADALGAERGQKTAELKHAQEAAAQRAREITRVERLEREELASARAERQTLDDLENMLQHFRETIKEAGPHIMRALLRQISVEANRIFGEIMGDRSAQLSWEQDYEIVLRRDGRERTFALLSGGEQMSAALAVRLALLRSLSRLDIAFFDEPTQNMDGQRRGNLADQIRRIRGFEQLLVISHDDTFEQGLDSVIYLEKRDGETVVVDAEAMVAV